MIEFNFYKLKAVNNPVWDGINEKLMSYKIALVPDTFCPNLYIRKIYYYEQNFAVLCDYFLTIIIRECLDVKNTVLPYIIKPDIINENICVFELVNNDIVLPVSFKYLQNVSTKIFKSHLDGIIRFFKDLVMISNDTNHDNNVKCRTR